MHKLRVIGSAYYNELRKPFQHNQVPSSLIESVKDFAYEMCFGSGHHRTHRTGGQHDRKAGEKFCNTFQGKLAEAVVRECLTERGLTCGKPDFNVYGEGVWDDCDLTVNGKTLSIKSAAYFSNLLLLEKEDYDYNGNYLPNLNAGGTASYDYYLLVRIKPDIKQIFRNSRMLFSDNISKESIDSIISSQTWYYDIAGWITHSEFVSVIRSGHVILQNALLNGSVRMDASNYYVQSGDMHPIEELVELLS
ncbi:MAG: hypothetical protein K2K81_01750 [Muribaculaceae bacterium]|nr:hypothetical protein [Muribaculaceae bacterium]